MISKKHRKRFEKFDNEKINVYEKREIESKTETGNYGFYNIAVVYGCISARFENVPRQNYANNMILQHGQCFLKIRKGEVEVTDDSIFFFGDSYYKIRADFTDKTNSVYDRFLCEKLPNKPNIIE